MEAHRDEISLHQRYVHRGVVRLRYISIDEKIVDILTKSLSGAKFIYFRDKLGMAENASLTEREC